MTQAFLVALQFLTCLPVRFSTLPDDKTHGYSLLFYPLIGLIIGTLLVLLGWLLSDAPPLLAAALVTAGWVLLTGGLHLDGLADSADAWMGGMGDKQKTLIIMKDPNCGMAGVTAIVLMLLLKFSALHSLFAIQEWIVLIYATVLARTLIILLFLTTSYVRNQGLGASIVNHQSRKLSVMMIITTFVALLYASDMNYIWLPLAAIVVFSLLRWLMIQRIQGTTGDTAGALVEISEVSVLLTAVLCET